MLTGYKLLGAMVVGNDATRAYAVVVMSPVASKPWSVYSNTDSYIEVLEKRFSEYEFLYDTIFNQNPVRRAVCNYHKHHNAPEEECGCGYYAARDPYWLFNENTISGVDSRFFTPRYRGASDISINGVSVPLQSGVMAEVRLSGRLVEHDYGWRAEYAQITRIATARSFNEHLCNTGRAPACDPFVISKISEHANIEVFDL